MHLETSDRRLLKILTILLTVSLAAVSAGGAFDPSTYERDSASMAAQGVGQDLVNLFLVVPLLLISFLYARNGSRPAILLYGGTLLYILYSYVIYSFGVHFNRLFLLYCTTLGLSLYAFILLMMSLRKIRVSGWFGNVPVKPIAGYLVLVAAIFGFLWLSSILPAVIRGEVPEEVAAYDLLVNPVHVADLSFALPGLVIGAVLLWKERDLGYLLASFALVFMILLTIALAAMVLMLVIRDISEDFTVAAVFGALTITSLIFSILLLGRIRSNPGAS